MNTLNKSNQHHLIFGTRVTNEITTWRQFTFTNPSDKSIVWQTSRLTADIDCGEVCRERRQRKPSQLLAKTCQRQQWSQLSQQSYKRYKRISQEINIAFVHCHDIILGIVREQRGSYDRNFGDSSLFVIDYCDILVKCVLGNRFTVFWFAHSKSPITK